MGQAPLTFVEIDAWQRVTGICLDPWESLDIRQLSVEWCAQADRSSDPECPAPYAGEARPEELNVVARGLRAVIRGMAS